MVYFTSNDAYKTKYDVNNSSDIIMIVVLPICKSEISNIITDDLMIGPLLLVSILDKRVNTKWTQWWPYKNSTHFEQKSAYEGSTLNRIKTCNTT